jgi:hypothetical protein
MKKLFAVAVLALAPGIAAAAGGARLQVGLSQNNVAFGGADGNLAGAYLGVSGVSRRLGGVGVRARLSYAVGGGGASLETLAVRAVAYPRQGISPYLGLGVLDLSTLAGATSVATSYAINTTTGVISPVTTTTALPPTSLVMGVGLVGLRARYVVNPRLLLTAHAALGAGFGGSTTGLPPAAGSASQLATSLGVGMRYAMTRRLDAALTYTRTAIPVRGATYRSGEVAIQVSALFH